MFNKNLNNFLSINRKSNASQALKLQFWKVSAYNNTEQFTAALLALHKSTLTEPNTCAAAISDVQEI